jgi:mannose-6-phosphate isomerase-like protein (cupin superfamily)
VIVYDLGPEAVGQMIRVDLAQSDAPPESPIGEFAFHGCTCGIGSFSGRPPWERHSGGDELLLVLAGETELTVLEGGTRVSRVMGAGALVVVPQGCWHNNDAPSGVTMFYATPTEGNEHSWEDPTGEDRPGHRPNGAGPMPLASD